MSTQSKLSQRPGKFAVGEPKTDSKQGPSRENVFTRLKRVLQQNKTEGNECQSDVSKRGHVDRIKSGPHLHWPLPLAVDDWTRVQIQIYCIRHAQDVMNEGPEVSSTLYTASKLSPNCHSLVPFVFFTPSFLFYSLWSNSRSYLVPRRHCLHFDLWRFSCNSPLSHAHFKLLP